MNNVFWTIVLSVLADSIDGIQARRLNKVSPLGFILDHF